MFNHHSRRPGLVVYLTVGDPDLATTRAIALAAIDAGADVLELGVPFSDPRRRPRHRACQPSRRRQRHHAGRRPGTCEELRGARPQAGLVIFSYLNPIFRYGLERFTAAAKDAGVDGVLATDLTIEEAEGRYLDAMRAAGLAPIFLVAPTSTDDRLRRIAAVSQGFVYAISRVGITGTQQTLASDARSLVDRLRRYTKLPIAVGFGVSNASHVAALSEFADAAVVGSAIVGLIEKTPPKDAPAAVAQFIEGLRPVPTVR